jgi:hypothetical protein
VIDRLLLLAEVRRDPDGQVALAPPPGGYLLSSLELDDAMRLLGGRRPRFLLAGAAAIGLATLLLAAAVVLLGASFLTT